VVEPNKLRSSHGRPSRAAVYERLRVQIGELRERLGGLPSPVEAEGIWRGIWLEEAHHSTAIEGNTLVLKQVELLLAEGRAVGNKELSEYLEVRGYANAADWVYGRGIQPETWTDGELISMSELRRVHALAMTPVWDVAPHPQATEREAPGSFREHDIEPFPGGMQPTHWTDVPALMRDWITDVQRLRGDEQATLAETLALLHARFEQVHPFLDGNGRAGRLLLNAYDHLQEQSLALPRRAATRRPGRSGSAGGTARSRGARQPLQVRRPRGRGPGPARATARAGYGDAVGERPACRGDPRPPQGREGGRRHVAQLACLGRRVRRVALPAVVVAATACRRGWTPLGSRLVGGDLAIRRARAGDEEAITALHARCIGDALIGLYDPPAVERAWVQLGWTGPIGAPRPRHALLVAERGGRTIGFTAVGPSRDADCDAATIGELRVILLDASARGGGVGSALVGAAERELRASALAVAKLWVIPENAAAVRCYERCGWSPDGARRTTDFGGREIGSVRYERELAD
jgi:GNAT superfamily N-acetyltransferase